MKDRPITTTTTSITFDDRLFAVMEADRGEQATGDRSLFIRRLLEGRYYGAEVRPVAPGAEAVLAKIAAGKFKRVNIGGRFTITRSISFDLVMFDVFEADRLAMPSRDRSQFIGELLESRYYGQKMRPVSAAARKILEKEKKAAAARR